MSITHNKKQIPLLNLLNSFVFARSGSQVFSIKIDCTFLLLNFLIIGLCNSSAYFLFEIFSLLTVPPEHFLSKKL